MALHLVQIARDEERRVALVDEPRLHLAIPEAACRIFEIDPIGGGVLRDDQKLLHAGGHQALRLGEHVGGGT